MSIAISWEGQCFQLHVRSCVLMARAAGKPLCMQDPWRMPPGALESAHNPGKGKNASYRAHLREDRDAPSG